MTPIFPTRRRFTLALCALALAACSGAGQSDGNVPAGELVDMAMGSETAPVVLIEYASSVCPACAGFHITMKDTITTLTEEGKLRYVFREFPRNQVDIAGFAVARCAGADKYFDVLDDLFEKQQGLAAASRNGTIRTALQTIGTRHGIPASEFEACLENEEARTAISNASKTGISEGVANTPTLFLNGVKLEGGEGRSPESLIELVEAGL